jgi:hypothetical protein
MQLIAVLNQHDALRIGITRHQGTHQARVLSRQMLKFPSHLLMQVNELFLGTLTDY